MIRRLIGDRFEDEYIAVLEGGRDVNQSLLEQKFDYIFFTGSVSVGKTVMAAAAKVLSESNEAGQSLQLYDQYLAKAGVTDESNRN